MGLQVLRSRLNIDQVPAHTRCTMYRCRPRLVPIVYYVYVLALRNTLSKMASFPPGGGDPECIEVQRSMSAPRDNGLIWHYSAGHFHKEQVYEGHCSSLVDCPRASRPCSWNKMPAHPCLVIDRAYWQHDRGFHDRESRHQKRGFSLPQTPYAGEPWGTGSKVVA